jgi:hypothetical protein
VFDLSPTSKEGSFFDVWSGGQRSCDYGNWVYLQAKLAKIAQLLSAKISPEPMAFLASLRSNYIKNIGR